MMQRGIPVSVALHALAFAGLLLYGSVAERPRISAPNVINVRLVDGPKGRAPAAAVREPATKPMEPVARPDVARPPKQLPHEKPKPKDKPKPAARSEGKPGLVPAAGKPGGTGSPGATGSGTGISSGVGPGGPGVSGTDRDFPFAYYLEAVRGRIVANWNPRQLGFGQRAQVSCSVHFVVSRTGQVSQVSLVRNSGVGVYDREALSAVQRTQLPPLPPQFRGNDLGVTFDFKLEPGAQ